MGIDPGTGAYAPVIVGLTSAIDVLPIGGPGATEYLVLEHATGNVLSGAGQLTRMAAGQPPVLLEGCLSRPTSMERDERSGDVFISEIVGGRVVVVR